jgi:predicted phosphodiesterase
VENARTAVRYIRGNSGKTRRAKATVPKPNGKAGQKPKMPPSLAEPWTPFVIEGCKKVGVISDVHIPYHDPKALEAAIVHLTKIQPDTLLLNGDFADFYGVSHWQRDPRKRRFTEERKLIIEGLDWIRECFPKAKIFWKDGNHEERWTNWLWSKAPEIYDLPACQIPELLEFSKNKIEYITDKRPVLLGKLTVFHGHELPKGLASPVNAARGAFMKMLDSVMIGHGHRSSTHAEPNWMHREITCWSTGCLCDMTPEYARINKWNFGFALVEVASDGEYGVHNMRIAHGKVRAS